MTEQDAAIAEVQRAIFGYVTRNDYAGLQDYIIKGKEHPDTLLSMIWALLDVPHVRGAYLMAKLLHMNGMVNPILSFALYCGGKALGNAEDADTGKRLLRDQFDSQPAEMQKRTYDALEPLILQQLSLVLSAPDLTRPMLSLLDIVKQVAPDLRARFDFDAVAPPLDIEALKAAGRAATRLTPLVGPKQGVARAPRKAMVAFREFVFPHFTNSRLLEQGPTMVNALVAYGWTARFHGLEFNKHEIDDAERVVAACLADPPDVLVLDAVLLHFPRPIALIAELRTKLPNMKIVGLYFDAWSCTPKQLRNAGAHFDLMWTVSPDFVHWQMPEIAAKIFQSPLPRGGDFGGPILPLHNKMHFSGGIAAYNWHRGIWIAAMQQAGIPIEKHMSAFVDDNLPPLESYVAYMRRLADGRCGINFSMRQDMTTFSLTARSFEIMAAGSLLVQESCPEMDCYFTAGEHYLPFSSFAELKAVAAFIAEKPAEAEKIRRAGNAFYRERYHDNKIVGYLDQALYP